jgi:putative ABC transport system ATP-binding protein
MDVGDNRENLFYLKDIRKTFHNGTCLDFKGEMSIRRGSFTFITGNSGIGKSTLLHILGLLDRADFKQDGSILKYRPTPDIEEGYDYFHLYKNDQGYRLFLRSECACLRRKDFGFLPQGGHLLHSLSIWQNLEAVYLLRSRLREKDQMLKTLQEVSESVGFNLDIENKSYPVNSNPKTSVSLCQGEKQSPDKVRNKWKLSPAVLSGGEAQRLALARAILCNPNVIFVDEPTTFMDGELIKLTMKCLLNRLNSNGCSIILISHDYEGLQKILKGLQPGVKIDAFHLEKKEIQNIQEISWSAKRHEEKN